MEVHFRTVHGFNRLPEQLLAVRLLFRTLRKEVVKMNLTHLKKFGLFLALLFVLEGCAFYVRGHGEYYEHYPHHYHHYGYWR